MWSVPVDLYCERLEPLFWGEPVNALTNVSFLLAAAVAFVEWRRLGGRDRPVLALIVLTVIVGVGSFAFHTLATRGAVLLDLIPIAAFIYAYLLLALRRFLQLTWIPALAILAAFIALSHGLDWVVPRGFMNGSYAYLPALAAMLVVGSLVPNSRHGTLLYLAAVVFTLSLVFRTFDLAICGIFPLGTHFIWHSLNGLVLYILLRAAMAKEAAATA
jgi:hypothetical protein